MEPTRAEFLHLPEWQKVLFYVLTFASLAYLAWQVWGRVRLWRRGKRIDWRPDLAGNVFRFVLGQKKVQTSRVAGAAIMHLCIFYGFLALLLATTLLAIATYAPLAGIPNFHRGTYYLVYESVFDVLGLFFVFGVGWAMARRWLRRPLVVSHAWSDSWALILLLLVGATGYLLEAARMRNSPQPFDVSAPAGYALSKLLPEISASTYLGIWWFHMAWVLVFFAVIPKMRLRHIVMAVFSAAGKPETPMGALRTIPMEEVEQTGQIGVANAADYSRWHLMSLDACMECGRCTEVCPANGVGKTLNPKLIAQGVRQANATGAAIAETLTEEALWACTTCNACVEACPVLIRHVDLIVDARRYLVAEGRFSGTGAAMLRQIGGTSNAWGQPAASREDWMQGLDVPLCRDGAEFEFLFWVGCAGATDPGAVKTTKAVAELLKKAGVSFACLGREEACTGDPARRVGDEFLFQDHAQRNASAFEKYGVRKVVTACPHCFNSFKNEYGDFGAAIEVWHHSQLIADLIARNRLRPASPERGEVAFHDPCYLGRINNESDAPRRALGDRTSLNSEAVPLVQWIERDPSEVRNLAEPPNHGRKTLCCGAGGGRMWMEEAPDQRPGNRRARELLGTGAKTVAVACPFCRIMLDASFKQVVEDEVRLVDLAEMVRDANQV